VTRSVAPAGSRRAAFVSSSSSATRASNRASK
jgi:hypothetical protein